MPRIQAVREGHRWAVKHDGGYLGYAGTQAEAEALAATLGGPEPSLPSAAWAGAPTAHHIVKERPLAA